MLSDLLSVVATQCNAASMLNEIEVLSQELRSREEDASNANRVDVGFSHAYSVYGCVWTTDGYIRMGVCLFSARRGNDLK